ncbi:hypothetical protein M153_28000010656, partial [Pseudoloma neurophilia]
RRSEGDLSVKIIKAKKNNLFIPLGLVFPLSGGILDLVRNILSNETFKI